MLGKDVGPDVLLTGIRHHGGRRLAALPTATRALITRFLATPDDDAPPAPPESLATLTGREREVMALAAHGRSNADIADHLALSPLTVDRCP
ncbi:LuxR C-terminal-related transcriptional regulator [Streptomyces sp. NPDC017988]|uniref:LuxR C-terminal-related transcriptional regulator n=1 Tax=Streptomyces sp. NPDC017988 TaxID=3365025 RepID=UPI0037AE7635